MSTTATARYPMAVNDRLPAHAARKVQVRAVLTGDLIATAYAIGMGIALRDHTLFRGISANEDARTALEFLIAFSLLVFWNVTLWTQGTRRFDVIGSGAREYWEVARITGINFAIVVTVSYVFKLEIARGFVLFTFPIGLLLLLTWRWTSNRNARLPANRDRFTPKAIVLTKSGNADHVWDELGEQFPQLRVVGQLQADNSPASFEDVKALVLSEDVDFVIVGPLLLATPGFVRELTWSLAGFDARIVAASSLMRPDQPQLHITRNFGQRIALFEDLRLDSAQRFKKRSFDLVLTIGAMPVWLPMVLVLALLVKLTSRGPAFYSHIRVGMDGEHFRMWKLRTMVRDAEQRLQELLDRNEATGPLFKMERDPRVTMLGRFLRKTSLDELPQLFNVLKGEMSLVGPRPQLPQEVLQYEGQEHRRFVAKPGLTGLWQISGSAKLDWDATISLDLEYIHTWTLWLDAWVLLRTLPEVVFGRGS